MAFPEAGGKQCAGGAVSGRSPGVGACHGCMAERRCVALALHVGTSCPNTRMLHPELPTSPGPAQCWEVASPSQDQGPHPTAEIIILAPSMLSKEYMASPTGGSPQETWDLGGDPLDHLRLSLSSTAARTVLCDPTQLVQQQEVRRSHHLPCPIFLPFDPNCHHNRAIQTAG